MKARPKFVFPIYQGQITQELDNQVADCILDMLSKFLYVHETFYPADLYGNKKVQ